MRRLALISIAFAGLVLAAAAIPLSATSTASSRTAALRGKTSTAGYDEPLCVSRSSLCADTYDNPGDEYVGHDEPSLEFKSGVTGSGNDITYNLTLPQDPNARPSASGGGATWNFDPGPTLPGGSWAQGRLVPVV